MSAVFYIPLGKLPDRKAFSQAAAKLLGVVFQQLQVQPNNEIPLKVHFGEKGNITFITPDYYAGIIDYLKQQKIASRFMDTNVLYQSPRMKRSSHLKLALEHGFTELPIEIADGENGENFNSVPVNLKHFQSCKIAGEFARFSQFIILSHFKGHMLAGFGGAIKQLAMGFAARGGKLDQHGSSKPAIKLAKCISCKKCIATCPVGAIKIDPGSSYIDQDVCIGCALCMGVCPEKAIAINWLWDKNSEIFFERLAEYAYAAQIGKTNIYITFALNITPGCDCEGHVMSKLCDDIGVFAATDPVAIDQAVLDLLKTQNVSFMGQHTLDYAEKIGLGSKDYKLMEIC